MVANTERPVHYRFVCSAENIVSESFAKDLNMAFSCRSENIALSYGILWRILHFDLYLHPYKVQLTQQLEPADQSLHRRYLEWMHEQEAVEGNFLQ